MGKWQEEYERQWESYTKDTLRTHFGRQYARYEVTTSDKYELRDLLRTMGSSFDPFAASNAASKTPVQDRARRRKRRSSVRFQTPVAKTREYDARRRTSSVAPAGASEEMVEYDAVPATQVLYTQDDRSDYSDDGDSGNHSDASMQSDVSYVYHTPQPKSNRPRRRQRSPAAAMGSLEKLRLPKKRQSNRFSHASSARSSTSTFPGFEANDLQGSRDQTRLSESMSQTLRQRLAGMSPISRMRFSMDSALDDTKTSEKDESAVLFAMEAETQTPNAATGGRGLSLARTPMPMAPARRQKGRQNDDQEKEKEPTTGEPSGEKVVDLDASMQSMHLEGEDEDEDQDDAMDGGDAEEQEHGGRKIAAALDFKGMSDDDDDEEEEEQRRAVAKRVDQGGEEIQPETEQQVTASASTAKPHVARWHWSEATMQGESESPTNDVSPTTAATATERVAVRAEQEVIEIDLDGPDEPEADEEIDYDFGVDDRGDSEDVCVETKAVADSGAGGGDGDDGDPLSTMLRNRLRDAGLPMSDEEEGAEDDSLVVNPFDSSSIVVPARNESPKRSTVRKESPKGSTARKAPPKGSPTASSSSPTSSSSSSPPPKARKPFYYRTKIPLTVEARSTHIDDRRRERRRLKLKRSLSNRVSHSAFREAECSAELAPYQREAVDWMIRREKPATAMEKKDKLPTTSTPSSARQREMYYDRLTSKIRGGILADEMGLGKTVCCIALICESLQNARVEASSEEGSMSEAVIPRLKPPTLIITPLSILGQWEKEIREKTNLSVISYQGHTRRQIQNVMDFMGVDVVLSTYDTLRLKECKVAKNTSSRDDDDEDEDEDDSDGAERMIDQMNDSRQWRTAVRRLSNSKKAIAGSKLHQLTWHRVILDESHLITNPTCARARAALFLKSKRRWCVTGTPIQNSGKDLSSLMTFLGMKHVAPDLDFHEVLSRVMLRRLKSTVDAESNEPIVQLPEKQDEVMELEFGTDLEKAYYTILHRSTKRRVFEYLRRQGRGGGQFMHVFELLLRLRQCCNSCSLVSDDPLQEVQDGNGALLAEIGTLSRQDAALIQRAGSSSRSASQHSTKVAVLLKELKKMKRLGERGLVVSQWTSFLDLIADAIHDENARMISGDHHADREGRTLRFCRLDGRMSAREREQAIASFQVEKRVDILLVSLRTGGLGLNLTAASQVFIMEPSWNPSIESQAIDRAHRVGQTKRVRVVRFLMKNTIEERVVELQRKKRALATATLGDSVGSVASSQAVAPPKDTALTRDELRGLFSQDNGDSPTQDRELVEMGGDSDADHDEMDAAIWEDLE